MFFDCCCGCFNLIGIGDIGRDHQGFAAQTLDIPAGTDQAGPSARQQAEMSAAARESAGDCPA